jgi:hypothetical protein
VSEKGALHEFNFCDGFALVEVNSHWSGRQGVSRQTLLLVEMEIEKISWKAFAFASNGQ